jgi:hypothetical protein
MEGVIEFNRLLLNSYPQALQDLLKPAPLPDFSALLFALVVVLLLLFVVKSIVSCTRSEKERIPTSKISDRSLSPDRRKSYKRE